jgi:hypothetical protein
MSVRRVFSRSAVRMRVVTLPSRLHTLRANSWLTHNGAEIRIRGSVAVLPPYVFQSVMHN